MIFDVSMSGDVLLTTTPKSTNRAALALLREDEKQKNKEAKANAVVAHGGGAASGCEQRAHPCCQRQLGDQQMPLVQAMASYPYCF